MVILTATFTTAHAEGCGRRALTRKHKAFAECAFGLVARARALLGDFNRREEGDAMIGQLVHELVVLGKLSVWNVGMRFSWAAAKAAAAAETAAAAEAAAAEDD